MESAFGIEHGDQISKTIDWDSQRKRKQKPSGGRLVAGAVFPGAHGAVAGKKGHKLRAMGNELGGAAIGSFVPGPGTAVGAGLGADRAAFMGHYKKQKKRK